MEEDGRSSSSGRKLSSFSGRGRSFILEEIFFLPEGANFMGSMVLLVGRVLGRHFANKMQCQIVIVNLIVIVIVSVIGSVIVIDIDIVIVRLLSISLSCDCLPCVLVPYVGAQQVSF